MCQSHLYRHGPTGGWSSYRSNDLLPGPQWDVHRVQGSSPNEPTPRLAIYKVRYNREIKATLLSSTVLLFFFSFQVTIKLCYERYHVSDRFRFFLIFHYYSCDYHYLVSQMRAEGKRRLTRRCLGKSNL